MGKGLQGLRVGIRNSRSRNIKALYGFRGFGWTCINVAGGPRVAWVLSAQGWRVLGLNNGSKDTSLDMLGTDIWAANTFDSFSGATWDLQPEKLDFTQFHRKLRHTPKQPLPHIDREGCGKGKLEDGDGINLNDIEKVLPAWQTGNSPSTRLGHM
ncbi:hypothetical protein J1605_004882 [Eschrichtius robustus]|uniref:Uncharacterized protein n=1 Tax=Eschrichtius robustus TaxID=9764 RepID=A0AB34HFV3_ESCRO|nr:hypothetical protein J1605_004882 [Eschrichtius robustus]